MRTIGDITYSTTREFQGATFINNPSFAYEVLDSQLAPGWYPEYPVTDWTDIAVLDGKYYACYGQDSVMTEAELIYIEIEPTLTMILEYGYKKK